MIDLGTLYERLEMRRELQQRLLAPIRIDRIKFRPANTGFAACYVDVRTVDERLDELFPFAWDFEMTAESTDPGAKGSRSRDGRLILHTPWGARVHVDTGSEEADSEKGGQAKQDKGLATDARKRCAVQVGIARYLYWIKGDQIQKRGDWWILPHSIVLAAARSAGYEGEIRPGIHSGCIGLHPDLQPQAYRIAEGKESQRTVPHSPQDARSAPSPPESASTAKPAETDPLKEERADFTAKLLQLYSSESDERAATRGAGDFLKRMYGNVPIRDLSKVQMAHLMPFITAAIDWRDEGSTVTWEAEETEEDEEALRIHLHIRLALLASRAIDFPIVFEVRRGIREELIPTLDAAEAAFFRGSGPMRGDAPY